MPFTRDGPPFGRRPKRLDRAQIKADVLRGLATGLPLAVIARRNGFSQTASITRWEAKDPAFAEEVAAARALGWDSLAVQCLEIADDRSDDVMHDKDGTARPNTANVLSRKLMIDTRLKLLACWDVGRYGASKTVKLEGEVQTTTRHVIDPRSLDEAGRAALKHLLAHAAAQGLLPSPEPQDADYEEVLGAEEDVADG